MQHALISFVCLSSCVTVAIDKYTHWLPYGAAWRHCAQSGSDGEHRVYRVAFLVPSQDICVLSGSCEGAFLVPSIYISMPSYSCQWGMLDACTKYLYVIIFLWMEHAWCLYKISVGHHIPVNGACLMPLQNICRSSYSCQWGKFDVFTKYLYVIFLSMVHAWCLYKISVCHHIPVNGANLMSLQNICRSSYSCEWGMLDAFKR